jgi:hypothetical protein
LTTEPKKQIINSKPTLAYITNYADCQKSIEAARIPITDYLRCSWQSSCRNGAGQTIVQVFVINADIPYIRFFRRLFEHGFNFFVFSPARRTGIAVLMSLFESEWYHRAEIPA